MFGMIGSGGSGGIRSSSGGRRESVEVEDVAQVSYAKCVNKLILDRENKIYFPGDIITGAFSVITRNDAKQINLLIMELEGQMYNPESSKNNGLRTIAKEKKNLYCTGTTCTGPLLKESHYKFEFLIPSECPPTITTAKFGWIKYILRYNQFSRSDCIYTLKVEVITIIGRAAENCVDYDRLIQPLRMEKQIGRNVDVVLITQQKCHEPGKEIRFLITVQNESGKNIRVMVAELQQIITNRKGQKEKKLVLDAIAQGPAIPSDSKVEWNAELKIPLDLLPCSQDSANHSLGLSFEYDLIVTLQRGGGLTALTLSSVSDRFPIQIGQVMDSSFALERVPKRTMKLVPRMEPSLIKSQ